MSRPQLEERKEKIKEHIHLRSLGGRWLKKMRLKNIKEDGRPLTQKEVAAAIGISSGPYIHSIENGGPSVPEDRWDLYADALQIDRDLFRRNMTMFYQTRTYIAFAGEPTKKQLEEGLGGIGHE